MPALERASWRQVAACAASGQEKPPRGGAPSPNGPPRSMHSEDPATGMARPLGLTHPRRLSDDDEGRPDAGVGVIVRRGGVKQIQGGLTHHLAV
jgi:hypothetical protein